MQFIAGSALSVMQQTMGRDDKVRVLQKVAEALHAAHMQSLIHRDIKPANIMLETRPDGTRWPYLMDFGLVRAVDSHTQTSAAGIEGTPAFMAPEQVRCETRLLDARADIYGMGATLYSALAGRPPFVGSATDVLMAVVLNDPPRLRAIDPMIPPALETIVEKCLEKQIDRRYGSALELAEDLGRYLDGERIAARPPGLLRRAQRIIQRHKLLVASVMTALLATLVLGTAALRIRWQAAEQARLAQHLGQGITKMEWLLRSARQLPLHDLNREKVIVRQRMRQLHAELTSYGQLSQGLAHYALGRGHMALHEYPQALAELEQAIRLGVRGAEIDYALGFVLGKHFELAIYEARLSGGGDWARKQLSELAPKYLAPAIASLMRSREVKLDAPQYLEGLIAYYQRDYASAQKHAATALREAPWLYEASKLAGDIHLDKALQAKDSGRYEEAEREFAESVHSYEAAMLVGQSDAEVYAGLAEAWVRQLEMRAARGQALGVEYAAVIATSDKLTTAEPDDVTGLLKKALASAIRLSTLGTEELAPGLARECMTIAEQALQKQPGNPYASDMAANCYMFAADVRKARGESPEPLFHKAQTLLEEVIKRHPHFLWALNDLGNARLMLGRYLQRTGQPQAKGTLQKATEQYAAAAVLDPTHVFAWQNSLAALSSLISESRSADETAKILARADDVQARCTALNNHFQQCFNNYFQIYSLAAAQALLAGQDPEPMLTRALANLEETRKLGGSILDAEQHAALTHLIMASHAVRARHDPGAALVDLQGDLNRCLALAAQDAMCRTLAARAELVQAEWLARKNKPAAASLEAALARARLATQSPEAYPDAWQAVAEVHLRLASGLPRQAQARTQHIAAGLAAAAQALSINPGHALGLATQGALYLLHAQAEPRSQARRAEAEAAARSLEQALQRNPFLSHAYTPLLSAARGMAQPEEGSP